jgi:flagellar biosynthesis anti-sigma factor FlgM
MKIDDNRGGLDPVGGPKTEAVRDERTAAAEKAARDERVASDQVHVSSASQLAAVAATKASEAPDVRTDAVERAKARLASGELGDAGRIADALIDQAIDKR